MIASAQTIRRLKPIIPFHERTVARGMTYGLGPAGYDVRLSAARNIAIPRGRMVLAATEEHFNMPNDYMAQVCDKSTWARRGVFVQNTVIEPGWRGFLTLEITYNGNMGSIQIEQGSPIAQIIFMRLDEPTEAPYNGKYQDQAYGPQKAIHEALGGA